MSAPASENTLDKFTLINCLAQGSHCQVWEVTEGAGGARRVAMKLLNPEAFKDPAQKASLKQEHQIGKSFDHPGIVKYHELVMAKTHGYFIMELFRAPSLKSAINTDLNSVQYRIKRLVELLSLALEHVHEKGWIHKDIKPDNILFNRASEVRLIDFSLSLRKPSAIAKLFTRKAKLVQGTRTYMAPEQIKGESLSPQTDMYSFGISLFECLTGEPPFKGSTPMDLLVRHCTEPAPPASLYNKNVTPEMDRLVQRLLEKKPEKRFKTMSDFLLEFRRVNVWKEPIPETVAKVDEAEEAAKNLSLGERRDSRSDALMQEAARANAGANPVVVPPATAAAKPGVPPSKPVVQTAPPKPAPAPPPAGSRAAQPAAATATRPAAPPAGQPVAGQPVPRPAAPASAVRPAGAPTGTGQPPAARPAPAPQPAAGAPRPAPAAGAPRPAAVPPPAAGQPVGQLRPAGQPRPAAGAPQPAAARPAGAPPRPAAPAPARPAATQPAARPPARPPVKPPASPPPADDSMNIEDLPSFDDLPPVI